MVKKENRVHVVSKACKVIAVKLDQEVNKARKVLLGQLEKMVKKENRVHVVSKACKVIAVKLDQEVNKAHKVPLARTAKMAKMVFQVKMARTAKTVRTVNQVNRLLKHQRSLKNQIPHHIHQKPLRSLANQKT
ncbi:Uncharacterised protein [Streptococcus pyogenes]|nr:Uncharacterised protein [Streptococcus pyogenes]VGZ17656.1 Uncharacterised protein [Streptococcus pyogenes]